MIIKLDEATVNRIAAGEIIQRPCNALKELLENSLDAKATKIQIIVRNGGLSSLIIADNGTGIRKEDLAIVCERYTTSKLSKLEDLSEISTFGFRGEALASIAYVSHLRIISKVEGSIVGYSAEYRNGKLKAPPKPIAGERGTRVIVENLFYNVKTRKDALKSPRDEHNRILDVVKKYAVHNAQIAFSFSKYNDRPEFVTINAKTVPDVIGQAFGYSVQEELIEVKHSDATFKFDLYGQITNVNYSNKKLTFLLFINNRLVVSRALKVIIDQVYNMYLPKNGHPFVYLSISIHPACVDVNVHPSKQEVHILHEEEIFDKIRTVLETTLHEYNESRVVQPAKLPFIITLELPKSPNDSGEKKVVVEEKNQDAQNTLKDCEEKKIEKRPSLGVSIEKGESSCQSSSKPSEKRDIKLTSILQLRADIKNSVHQELQNMIRNFIFVGIVNRQHCVLQHETKVYLCKTENLIQEMMYQILLNNFANFGVIRFSTPLPIKSMILKYFQQKPSYWTEIDGSKADVAKSMTELFIEKSAMLEDYFSIEIDGEGNICTLPWLLEKYVPDVKHLPGFIVKMCTKVDWFVEKPCLEGICREIARFYSKVPKGSDDKDWEWVTEHVLFTAIKDSLLPPAHFAKDGTISQMANLPDLYKIFERC